MLTLTSDELLGYTNEERAKWKTYFASQPAPILAAPVQREGRFSAVWRVVDHIFLVEKRHLQRLKKESPLSEKTGVPEGDHAGLFAFGEKVRAELAEYVRALSAGEADRVRDFDVQGKLWAMTPRKLVFHILVHEVRHWAQVVLAVRNAGFEPPGQHDLFHTSAMT